MMITKKKQMSIIIIIVGLSSAWIGNSTPLKHNPEGDYVVILHGIARSSSHMDDLAHYLADHGYDVINLDYPSTDHTLEQLVEITHKNMAAKLTKDKPVHMVGYSMGGLLVRAVIHKHRPKNLGRVVQLASPNHGSEVADFIKNNWFYQEIYGPAGQQLTTEQMEKLKNIFGKVDYELGIIAGNSTIDPVSSFIIPEDDDGKVSIESTKLKGMKDHIVVEASHTFFPSNKDAHKQTLYFLQHGVFEHEPAETSE